MKNTGKQYELLTKQILQDILNQSDVKTIEVKHNVIIKGKTTKHQIDVYWKFELNGIVYDTVVQAKDWSSPVNQGELLKFKAVLDDIPGSPKGIFVTRTGYHSGARDYAKVNGIELYELRAPSEADFEGRIRTIHFNIILHIPSSSNLELIPDNDWIVKERKRLGIPDHVKIPINISEYENKTHLFDENKKPRSTLLEIVNSMFPSGRKPFPKTKNHVKFKEPRFIKTNAHGFPWMKINGISAEIKIDEVRKELVLKAEDIVGFILKLVSNGSIRKFDKEGKEIRRE